MKIPMLCSLLVTLMLIHKIGGNTNNEGIAIDNLLSAFDLKLYVNPQILKKRKIPLVLI